MDATLLHFHGASIASQPADLVRGLTTHADCQLPLCAASLTGWRIFCRSQRAGRCQGCALLAILDAPEGFIERGSL